MSELELLRKEIEKLQKRVKELEERERARDQDIREGYLMIVRGAEKRLQVGKYDPELVSGKV